jgi:hypothetical protein
LTGSNNLSAGQTTTLSISGAPASSTAIYTANGVSHNVSLPLGSYNINTGVLNDTTTYALLSVSNGGCTFPLTDTIIVFVHPNTWTGGAGSSNWNDPGNWSSGSVPADTTPVLIPAVGSGTPTPSLPSGTVITQTDMQVDSGATITVSAGATIAVSGNVTITGNITGSGTVELNGTTPQTIGGSGTVTANISITNTSGVTVPVGDTFSIAGVITLGAGATLTSTNNLVLVSDDNGNTGSIGPLPAGATVTGPIMIQRYVPGGRRAFRFFGHCYNAAIPLNPELTSVIDITGPSTGATAAASTAAGFTPTTSNSPSAFWYNPLTGNASASSDPGWTAFTNALATTGSNSWKVGEAVRVLIRGPKNFGLTGTGTNPPSIVMVLNGTINTGDMDVNLYKGSFSAYNIIGNVYPSGIKLHRPLKEAYDAGKLATNAFYIWDAGAAGTTYGAYVTYAINTSSATDTNYVLPMGAAFTVTAAGTAGASPVGVIHFHESDKSASVGDAAYWGRATHTAIDTTVSFVVYSNHDSLYWDRMLTMFTANAGTEFEALDGKKTGNPSLNMYAISSDNKHNAVDARPFVNNMIIPVGFTTPTLTTYKIRVEHEGLPDGYQLYLTDKYLNTVTPMHTGTEYSFDVTSDAASQGEGRFELNGVIVPIVTTSIGTTPTTPATSGAVSFAVKVTPNPATDKTVVSFEGVAAGGTTTIAITTVTGQEVYSESVKDVTSGKVNVPLQNLPAGIYMITVTNGSQVTHKQLVKE